MRVIFLDRCWVVHIPFVSMVELKFPAHFPVDRLADPVVSRRANLLHLLIMWLIVSSLSPHSLHLLFCWVLSILAFIIYSSRVSHISDNWWFYTGVWVTASLLRFPGLVYYYYYHLIIKVFLISVRWGSFTGVWVTASLLKSPGLISVFWSFTMT